MELEKGFLTLFCAMDPSDSPVKPTDQFPEKKKMHLKV